MEAVAVPLDKPVSAGGRFVECIEVREPTAGEFIDLGPIVLSSHASMSTGPSLTARLPIAGHPMRYLRRCVTNLSQDEIGAALEQATLADGIRVHRALQGLVPIDARPKVKECSEALAFGWRLMSLRDADAMGVSELFATVTRLADYAQRQKKKG